MARVTMRDDPEYIIQDIIFKKMKRQNVSQTELARRLGVSTATVQRWKNHESIISMAHAEKALMSLRDDTRLDVIRALIGGLYQ